MEMQALHRSDGLHGPLVRLLRLLLRSLLSLAVDIANIVKNERLEMNAVPWSHQMKNPEDRHGINDAEK